MNKTAEATIQELLARIVSVENQIALILQRLSAFEKQAKLRTASSVAFGEALMDQQDSLKERIDHAFERLKGLEVYVFPNLINDIESVHRIIGGDGVPATPNPLDVRSPENRKPNSA